MGQKQNGIRYMHFISTILFVRLLDLFLFILYNLKLLLELLSNLPSRVTSKSKTLVDNIFFEEDIIEEELIQVTSPLPYLINMLNLHFSKTNTALRQRKKTQFHKDFIAIDNEKFELDLRNTNWNQILEIENRNIDGSFDISLKTSNHILDKHAPLKKLSIREKKL